MARAGAVARILRWLLAVGIVGLVIGFGVVAVMPGGPIDVGDGGGETGTPAAAAADGSVDATPTATGSSRPWDDGVMTVAVRNQAAPERNVTAPVAEAIAYWNDHGEFSDYQVTFRLAPDASDPAVVVWYNRSITCPAHDDAIGCAPLLDGAPPVETPIDVQLRYDDADNHRQVRNTAIHEFGHVLGIAHCEEPRWVMGPSCEERLPDQRDAVDRAVAWRDRTISVYVDDTNVSDAERGETAEQVQHALTYLDDGGEGTYPESLSIVRVEDRFEADISVIVMAESSCEQGVVCNHYRGRDTDGDGVIEYHTAGTIKIEPGTDVEARGWYVGWGLANQLSRGDLPSVFVDASYEERRSRWWE